MANLPDDVAALCEEARAMLAVMRVSVELTGRRWLSVADAAKYTGLSQKSIRRLLAAGKLPASRPVPGKVAIEREAIDRYMHASINSGTCTRIAK